MNLSEFLQGPHFGRVLLFRLNNKLVALPLLDLKEVLEDLTVTFVPGAHPLIEGIFQLRGKILPLIHLHQILQSGALSATQQSRVLVIQYEQEVCAFRIDQILGIEALEVDNFPEENNSGSFEFKGENGQLVDAGQVYASIQEQMNMQD